MTRTQEIKERRSWSALAELYPWLFGSCAAVNVRHTSIVMAGGVYTVYRMNDRITITPRVLSVMLGGPQGWGSTGRVIVISASPRERAHGQRVFLVDSVQLFSAHGVSDELELLGERLAAVRHADIGDVGAADVVALRTLLRITGAQPVAFGLEVGQVTWVGSSDTSTTEGNTIWQFSANLVNFEQESFSIKSVPYYLCG